MSTVGKTAEELAAERLKACKQYMRVDFEDDDEIICGLLDAADGYLDGAGIDRAVSPKQYDLIAYAMTLQMYDGRNADSPEQAATSPLVRQMITQLKLRSGYGGADSDKSG